MAMWNVFQAIHDDGDDDKFEAVPAATPCPHPKHSWEQLEELRMRVERGEELFHSSDNCCAATIEQMDRGIALMKAYRIANKDANKPIRKPIEPRTCPVCGKIYLPLGSDKRRKNCSRECYILSCKYKPKFCKALSF